MCGGGKTVRGTQKGLSRLRKLGWLTVRVCKTKRRGWQAWPQTLSERRFFFCQDLYCVFVSFCVVFFFGLVSGVFLVSFHALLTKPKNKFSPSSPKHPK